LVFGNGAPKDRLGVRVFDLDWPDIRFDAVFVPVNVSEEVSEAERVEVVERVNPEEKAAPTVGVAVCVRPDVTDAVGVNPDVTVPDFENPDEIVDVKVPDFDTESVCVTACVCGGTNAKLQSYLTTLC